tara:strand:+ start:317 stop:820 length:504 start_codon:yes stop_codon:yes gene_type:complete
VSKKVDRNYLEIQSLDDLVSSKNPSDEFIIELIDPPDFQLNKFFYKNVGKKHHWVDRLIWTDKQWIDYINDKKVKTFILKKKDDLVGYYELILHLDQNETEIAYFGILEEYQNQKLGSFLLTSAIKNSFSFNPNRVWVHTCSLDHRNALNNYISRGMKVFKKETITI